MKLEIFIVFVINFELIVRISSAVIEHTDDCPDPVLYDDQSLIRFPDRAMVVCSESDERWFMTCQDGKWIGDYGPCSPVHRYCSAPEKGENEHVRVRGDHATVRCLTNRAQWHLTCVNGQWIGERGICPLPNCPELTYDKNVYEIITYGNSWVVMVSCIEPNPDGRRKSWYLACRDDKWFGYVDECDGRPH